MAGDPDIGADEQDQAEIFDETNITRDGERIAVSDLSRDVLDVTSARGDGLESEGEQESEDFDPDQADEAELEFMLEADDGLDEPRSFARDDADLVARGDTRPADFESKSVTDEELEDLGYAEAGESAERSRREARLDEGLEESFPASDSLAVDPRGD